MRVAVIGGSIAGLAGALFLARDGHEVVILESDETPSPDEMSPRDLWFRRGTPHGRQAHAFVGLFVKTMREHAPDVLDDITTAGAVLRPGEALTPASLGPVEGVEDLAVVNARRPLVEWAMRRAAGGQEGIDLRTGVHVEGLAARDDRVPRITGVRLSSGETVAADVVIDASGRRTQVERWLGALGVRMSPPEGHPCRMIYIGRYYLQRSADGLPSLNAGFVSVFPYPWGTALMFPGDNGVMQFAIGSPLGDQEVRDRAITEEGFHALMSSTPHIKDWAACGEPISDVGVMAGLHNYVRRLTVDGEPVVLGLHLAGDAAAITNPQFGRGVSHAAGHAAVVASAITEHPDDLLTQARVVDAEVERMLVPSVLDSIESDIARSASWDAGMRGEEPPPLTMGGFPMAQVNAAMQADPVVWKAVRSSGFMLQPPGSWKRDPEVVERIRATTFEQPPPSAAPSRDALFEAMDRAIAGAT